jgi:hypothetical protein
MSSVAYTKELKPHIISKSTKQYANVATYQHLPMVKQSSRWEILQILHFQVGVPQTSTLQLWYKTCPTM